MKRDLGSIIKASREKKGLSVRELAKLAKINHTDVSKLENNRIKKPSISMLVALSDVLEINLLAAYLETAESYLYYEQLIKYSVGLSRDQLDRVIDYIKELKELN